ncbi:cytochrome c3 family protein [Pseudoteredinibacter isoporae]|uniref:Putative CXXCH cytochrome family protein n=1 Tax=Pseudoteredinibacter isoporae TaxID=570281 RepID=A0A7X0MX02_9GAMM|nr:cytochrome c3 family protein [Pseudoteredinibacter isoporae]MBB6521539.1 putative CXXCH cytochrome family protein [Pseudoteredinibacter isoporae]NHO87093.1 hypothetical protein [Pseudoteredinibacter isoporae]NIB22840.1 hypothetical protein [Pseudoteredinibacter isoporae]
MLYLIRQTRKTGNKVIDQNDSQLESSAIQIGSGEGQLVQLAGEDVAAKHLVITAIDNQSAKFECAKNCRVELDGQPLSKGVLKIGQKLTIGRHSVELVSPPAGFACALEFEIDAEVKHSTKQRFKTDLKGLGYNRSLAYIVSALVLVFALGFPLWSMYDSDARKTLAKVGIPTDKHWSSGPLIPAHRIPAIGDDCTSCHAKPFEMVQDQACLSCHSNTEQHVHSKHPAIPAFEEYRCGSCHKEHNEPATIIIKDQSLCVDCHGNIANLGNVNAEDSVANVSGFNEKTHPEFRLGLLGFDGFKWELSRIPYSSELKENSQLKFPHDLHLDVDKVQSQESGEALECKSCHVLSADKEHFEPITMEGMCRDCHGLGFDDAEPTRQLPHGSPLLVKQTLEEYYIRMFADPDSGVEGIDHVRRVPGKRRDLERCQKGALDCGRERAALELENQFTKIGCITCHEVEKTEARQIDGKPSADSFWTVKPVKLNNDWYSQGRFNHATHLLLRDAPVDEICQDCHKAGESAESHDILIPGRENCLQCHDDQAEHAAPLDCVACHNYHIPGNQAIWVKQMPAVLEQKTP